jgi:hypothetical protein
MMPDPVTVYGDGGNDEETVMLQPVTYTGPAALKLRWIAAVQTSVFDADMLSLSIQEGTTTSTNQLGWK